MRSITADLESPFASPVNSPTPQSICFSPRAQTRASHRQAGAAPRPESLIRHTMTPATVVILSPQKSHRPIAALYCASLFRNPVHGMNPALMLLSVATTLLQRPTQTRASHRQAGAAPRHESLIRHIMTQSTVLILSPQKSHRPIAALYCASLFRNTIHGMNPALMVQCNSHLHIPCER